MYLVPDRWDGGGELANKQASENDASTFYLLVLAYTPTLVIVRATRRLPREGQMHIGCFVESRLCKLRVMHFDHAYYGFYMTL